MTLFTIIAGDGVLSEAEFVKGCLEDADLVGFAFCIYSTGCFFNWYPPKKLKYGKPRLGESTHPVL